MRRLPPRAGLAAVAAVLILGVACGGVEGPGCLLVDYSADMQQDLDAIAALDPALIAQAGTPENAAALAALDSLDATQATAQGALDATTDEEVGPVPASRG
jgi:hypothetical protein